MNASHRPWSAAPLLALSAALSDPAAAADLDPVLTVDGVSGDNTTAVTVLTGSTVQVTLTGTPGAPFALLMSAYADIGVPQGFVLTPWAPPLSGIHSPIQPVLDGIGSAYVAAQLGLPAGDLAPSTAVPFLAFDATGTVQFSAALPAVLPLLDDDPAQPTGYPYGPGQPVPYPLAESFSLFLQVLAVDTQTLGVRVGNAVQLEFLGREFDATLSISTGVDADPNSTTLGARQTLAAVVDGDLGDASLGTVTPSTDFAGTFGGATDVWMIQLAGPQEAVATAGSNDTTSSDQQYTGVHMLASSPDLHTGEVVARDNENPEFPRIRLPGGRQLFHWRNGSTNPPTYGFGVLFEETGTFRNLVPATFGTFSQTATRSPWEVEVAVTPDGDRAVVVLDRSSDVVLGSTVDRVFVLNLEENGVFANGLPIVETAPSQPALWRRVYEGSITFTTDGAGGWAGWVHTTIATSTLPALPPNGLWRIDVNSVAVPPIDAVASGSFPPNVQFHPRMKVNAARDTVCLVGGPTPTTEDVFSITNVTPSSWVVTNLTAFPTPRGIVTDGAASDGRSSFSDVSDGGAIYAGCRQDGSWQIPFVARTDGSDAGAVVDLVRDVSMGGDFDLDEFWFGQGLHFAGGGAHLLFHQGRMLPGAASDRCDLFVVDLATGTIRNLTRTIGGPPYDQFPQVALNGPWDVQPGTDGAPTVDYGGSFLAPDGRHRFLFRDRHLTADDRYNVYAVDVEPGPGGAAPSFALTNVTGNEFEPTFGTPPPAVGAPDLISDAGFFDEQTPSHLQLRRVGGTGPLRDFYFVTARLASGRTGATEHLFLFDSIDPGPALQVTDFGPATSPIAAPLGSRVTNVTPHPTELMVAFVLDQDGALPADQELLVLRLETGAVPVTVPNPGAAPTFSRSITDGSIHWLPGTKSALVWTDGATPWPGTIVDGVTTLAEIHNPIDATPWFFTFADPTNPRKILADAPAGTARAAMIWAAR